jgi:hypothetical protein
MALFWSWGFEINRDKTWYNACGWSSIGSLPTSATNNTDNHQPLAGNGGGGGFCLWVDQNTNQAGLETPDLGATTAGGVSMSLKLTQHPSTSTQIFYFQNGATSLGYVQIQSTGEIAIYSDGGLLATSTAIIGEGVWMKMGIKYERNSSTGSMDVLINGTSVVSFSSGDTGSTQSWNKVRFTGRRNMDPYFDHVCLFNSLSDDFTKNYFIEAIDPTGDDTDGSFTKDGGGAVDLYQAVDTYGSDYALTSTDPDTCKFTAQDRTDINASWAPANLHGVTVIASAKGDGSLINGNVVLEHGGSTEHGTTTAVGVSDNLVYHFYSDSPDSTAWVAADIDDLKPGYRAQS